MRSTFLVLSAVALLGLVGCGEAVEGEEIEREGEAWYGWTDVIPAKCGITCKDDEHCQENWGKYRCVNGGSAAGSDIYEGCAQFDNCGAGQGCKKTKTGNKISGTCVYLGCFGKNQPCSTGKDQYGRTLTCVADPDREVTSFGGNLDFGVCQHNMIDVYKDCASATKSWTYKTGKADNPHDNCSVGYMCEIVDTVDEFSMLRKHNGNCVQVKVESGTWCTSDAYCTKWPEDDCKPMTGSNENGTFKYGICYCASCD